MTLRLEKDNKKVRDQSSRQRRYTWSDELRVSCATAKKASPQPPDTCDFVWCLRSGQVMME